MTSCNVCPVDMPEIARRTHANRSKAVPHAAWRSRHAATAHAVTYYLTIRLGFIGFRRYHCSAIRRSRSIKRVYVPKCCIAVFAGLGGGQQSVTSEVVCFAGSAHRCNLQCALPCWPLYFSHL